MEDSIAAISTPVGEGGIAIIRISGPRALAIADAIFVSSKGAPSSFASHSLHLGKILGDQQQTLDEVLLGVMRRPHSYTTEDLIEINCHGGQQIGRSILAQCLRHGARLADPGEFTKRAFLNGRIDLTQAEAVLEVITAKTARAQIVAENALNGRLAQQVEKIRQQLLGSLAQVEAQIDFPEEDISPATRGELEADLANVIAGLEELLATATEGKILRDGISIAIFGRPNAGKSSLLNALLGEERAIVTDIPGTTRDTVEESANIRGIPVRFTDTAGIRKPRGRAEELGIIRSHKALDSSDIGIHIIDSSRAISAVDIQLFKRNDSKHIIRVLNKIDLARKLILKPELVNSEMIEISTVTGYGIEILKDRIEKAALNTSATASELEIAINERHANAVTRSIRELRSALSDLQSNASIEVVAQQLRIGFSIIGEIVGKTTTDDLLDSIFSKFCIGK